MKKLKCWSLVLKHRESRFIRISSPFIRQSSPLLINSWKRSSQRFIKTLLYRFNLICVIVLYDFKLILMISCITVMLYHLSIKHFELPLLKKRSINKDYYFYHCVKIILPSCWAIILFTLVSCWVDAPPSRESLDLHSTGRNSTCSVVLSEKCFSSIFLAASRILYTHTHTRTHTRTRTHIHNHQI